MNDRELDATLSVIHLDRMAYPDSDAVIQYVIDAPIEQIPQRRGWLPRVSSRRFQSMFNATRFVVAGAIVALFGGFLLSGSLTEQPQVTPAAETRQLGVAVSGTISDAWASPEVSSLYEGEDFTAGTYVLDELAVDFDDDRLDGVMSGRVEMAFYEPEVAVIGGPISIANEDGVWKGVIRGAGVTADDWVQVILLDGTGAYAGLSATLIPRGDESGVGAVTGVVYAPRDLDPSQRPGAATATD